MSPANVEKCEYMTRMPYASAVGSLMYAMVCKRPDLSQTVSMIDRYMHDPDRGHWEAVKWVLRYIKGTIDVGLVFEKDSRVSRSVSDMLILTMQETSTNAGLQTGYVVTLSQAPVGRRSIL